MPNLQNYLIIRPAEIFGFQKKKEGIDKLIDNIFEKKILFYPAQLDNLLYPIYIDDAVNWLYSEIFENLAVKKQGGRIVIINGPNSYTIKQILQTAIEMYYSKKSSAKFKIKRKLLLPLPKFFMYALYYLLKILPLKFLDLAPDQIPRLYGKKEANTKIDEKKISLSLSDYLIRKFC